MGAHAGEFLVVKAVLYLRDIRVSLPEVPGEGVGLPGGLIGKRVFQRDGIDGVGIVGGAGFLVIRLGIVIPFVSHEPIGDQGRPGAADLHAFQHVFHTDVEGLASGIDDLGAIEIGLVIDPKLLGGLGIRRRGDIPVQVLGGKADIDVFLAVVGRPGSGLVVQDIDAGPGSADARMVFRQPGLDIGPVVLVVGGGHALGASRKECRSDEQPCYLVCFHILSHC